jgi:hypothetical protein
MKRIILRLQLALIGLAGHAATYYVSPSGNDSNNGTSQAQAWRTVARAQQVAGNLQPGDQILFQRGGTYTGKLTVNANGSSGNPIIIGAYGTGNKPVISGSQVISNWTQWQGNIWRAPVQNSMEWVFVNGELAQLARYPNQGWLRMNGGSGTSFNSPGLTQPNGHWNGANVVIRTSNWSYHNVGVTGYNGSTVQHENTYSFPGEHNWGYFFTNKLSELDMPGEWYHDASEGYLYLWAPGNANPNTLIVEAAFRQDGVSLGWQRQHVRVQDLAFEHQTYSGIHPAGAHFITVQNCDFRRMKHAMASYGYNITVTGCLVEQTYGTGMFLMGNHYTVESSEFRDIALEPGLGEDMWGYNGLRTNGSDNVIRENRFDNIGYIAILFDGNTLVERNYVSRPLATLNDGGGIAFDHSNGAIIRNNIVTDLIGEFESSATTYWSSYPLSMGIYFGNSNIRNALVENNTVAHSTNIGIYVDHTMNSEGNVVTGNVLYNNGSGGGIPHRRGSQVRFSDHSNIDGQNAVAPYFVPYFDNVFTNNTLVSLSALQDGLAFYQIHTSAFTNYGNDFDNNIYFTPYNEQSIVNWDHFGGMIPHRHTLAHWQQAENKDLNSQTTSLRLSPWVVTNVIGPELVPNGTFDTNTAGWQHQVGGATLSNPAGVLDGKCLGVQFNTPNGTQRLLVDHVQSFSYTQGHFYELKFTSRSEGHLDLQVGVKGDNQSWAPEQLTFNAHVGVETGRSEHSLVFQAPTSGNGRVFFRNRIDQPQFYIDNVSLRRVEVEYDDPQERIILIYNDQLTSQTFALEGCFQDVLGNEVVGSITLAPFTSMVLVRDDDPLCGMTTGTEELDALAAGMVVFPNPARAGDLVRFAMAEDRVPAAVEVFDMSGQRMPVELRAQGQEGVQLPGNMASGAYVLRITHNDGRQEHGRLLVTR